MDVGESAEILTSHRIIRTDHLQRLLSHNALSIHVKEFYRPSELASAIGRHLAQQAVEGKARNWKVMRGHQRGMESTDVMTVGEHDPYNIAVANGTTQKYFNSVRNEFQHRRQPQHLDELLFHRQGDSSTSSSSPSSLPPVSILWPLDQVRLELDEAWPGGTGLARQKQEEESRGGNGQTNPSKAKVFGGGLPRIMMGPTRWKHGLVHVDQFAPLSTTQGLFSANIYLQLPNQKEESIQTGGNADGVLEIWPLGIRNQWEWYKNAPLRQALSQASSSAEIQYKLRAWLGPPQVIRDVSPGDLILLCAQRPHAAVGFSSSDIRVSLQCFIQHHGPNERLLIDC